MAANDDGYKPGGLHDDLACPICLDVRHDCKIFQCNNGHLICEPCHASVNECPVCRARLSRPGSRCLFAEKSIQALVTSCKYAKDGCGYASANRDQAEEHTASCIYGPVECPLLPCRELVTRASLLGHILKTHEAINLQVDEDGTAKSEVDWAFLEQGVTASIPFHLPWRGRLFLAVVSRHHTEYCSWVFGLWEPRGKEAKAVIAVECDNLTLRATTQTVRLEKKIAEIVADDSVLCMSSRQAKIAARDGAKIIFKLSIPEESDSRMHQGQAEDEGAASTY